MIDPIRTLRAELAAAPTVTAIAGDRIRRGDEAAGDSKGPGEYQAFVVLKRTGGSREKGNVPVGHVSIVAQCYGRDRQEAVDLYGAISDAIHNRGPRIAEGVLIYRSHDESDGGDETDDLTSQPYVEGVISLSYATQAVA